MTRKMSKNDDLQGFHEFLKFHVKTGSLSRYIALVNLRNLWNKSRALGLIEATEEQIDGWVEKGATKQLLEARYLKKNGDKYIIVDNEGR